jgi:hypothetical protein
MGGISNLDDARVDATTRAFSRLVSYLDDSSYYEFADDERLRATVDRAESLLRALNAPLFVAGYAIEEVIVLEIARIRSGQPTLTNLELIDIIRDVWQKFKDWVIHD